jgi:predicted nucleic acid-binding protein
MICLDTNVLIFALAGGTAEERLLYDLLSRGESLNISAVVWTEFLCGPVVPNHEALARRFFPSPEPFLPQDAAVAAELFNGTGRRRGSTLDCMIASSALRLNATFATNNVADFQRFAPWGLKLLTP